MFQRYLSSDGLTSHRSDFSRSPYAKNYRTNLTHDQRELLSHRQHIVKLPRHELEDRYIALMDDHFALKKDNANNHEKIKKMATKLLRLSAEGKSKGTPFPLQLSPNEHLEVQIMKLESYNALLKERLHAIIRKYSNALRSASTISIRRPASCSNLSIKRKMVFSQDDMNLLEIPPPPDVRSTVGTNSGIGDRKTTPKSSCKCSLYQPQQSQQCQQQQQQPAHSHQYSQSFSSTIVENDDESSVPDQEASVLTARSKNQERKTSINDFKNTIQKLENELTEMTSKNDSLKRINLTLEEKLTNEVVSKRITENIELIELRKTMVECEAELNELRKEYVALCKKAETELDEEQKRITELTAAVKTEMEKNKLLSQQLSELKNTTDLIHSRNSEIENQHLNNAQVDEMKKLTKEMSKNQDATKNLIDKNKELASLLSEAKTTILTLQENLGGLDEKVRKLTEENEMLSSKEQVTSRIPLEPTIIISNNQTNVQLENPTASQSKDDIKIDARKSNETKGKHSQAAIIGQEGEGGVDTDDSSGSENTFTIIQSDKGRKPQHHKKNHHIDSSHENERKFVVDAAEETGSIDSDENYRSFQRKNKELRNSFLLLDSNGMPFDFTERLNLLERAAYYRPLSIVNDQSNSTASENRFLTCNCGSPDCNQKIQSFYDDIRKAVENAKEMFLKEIKKTPNIHFDSNTNSVVVDNETECRQLLRVQYNLNSLYKQELEFMCKTCENQSQHLLNEINELRNKIQLYEDKLRAFELKSSKVKSHGASMTPRTESPERSIQFSYEEGSFELHVDTLRLTKEGRTLLSCRHGELSSLFFQWKFFNQQDASSTILKTGPNYEFYSATIYVIPIIESFLNRLKNDQLKMTLFAAVGEKQTSVGYATVQFGEVLLFPQNKIQFVTKVVSLECDCDDLHTNSVQIHCSCTGAMPKRKHLGNLSIWFRLTCQLQILRNYGTQLWLFDGKASGDAVNDAPHSDRDTARQSKKSKSIDSVGKSKQPENIAVAADEYTKKVRHKGSEQLEHAKK